jgi:hypothetical protein
MATLARPVPIGSNCIVFADAMFNRMLCISLDGAGHDGAIPR